MDPVHIKGLSHITPGGSNAPHLHTGPPSLPRRRGIKDATSLRPLPRRPVSSSFSSLHLLLLGHTATPLPRWSLLPAAAASAGRPG